MREAERAGVGGGAGLAFSFLGCFSLSFSFSFSFLSLSLLWQDRIHKKSKEEEQKPVRKWMVPARPIWCFFLLTRRRLSDGSVPYETFAFSLVV